MIRLIQRPNIEPEEEDEDEGIKIAKTPTELQRMKLEKLTKNINKPVSIPKSKKELKPLAPPEFVRNVVGSSAGAGSGEYHIYRNLRKREYARREFYEQQAKKDALDNAYLERVSGKKQKLEEKAAKRKHKREKRKLAQQKLHAAKGSAQKHNGSSSSEEEEASDDSANQPEAESSEPGTGNDLLDKVSA